MYASYKSLWLHNKKFHKNESMSNVNDNVVDNVKDIVVENVIDIVINNKIFSSRFTKSEHKRKACKLNPSRKIILDNNKLERKCRN